MFSYATTEKQLNSSLLIWENSESDDKTWNLEETTKSAGRFICPIARSFCEHRENSVTSPLQFSSSKIGILRIYLQHTQPVFFRLHRTRA